MEPRGDGRPHIGTVDLSEAYAAVRRRARQLRRRRIVSTIVAMAVFAGVASVVGVYYVSKIPLPEAVRLPETTTVYFADGTTVMARLGEQSRVPVVLGALPDHVPAAVVAAEDPGFWGGSGTRISREYARLSTHVEGGGVTSTARITVMAWKLEDSYSKRQILEFYLNTVYFGRGAYGIEAAARAYFGVPAADLDMAEAIVLAGLISSPDDGAFDPTVNPRPARQRFTSVRERMVALGAVDEATAVSLRVPSARPYDPRAGSFDLQRPTGHVVAHVLAELRESPFFLGRPNGFIENGNFKIVTTLDARAQALLEGAADETVAGSLLHGQTGNLQAAAAVVEPGTGRVIAYYGGHDGTGTDYAGWHDEPGRTPVGGGAHPPAQTFGVYALAAALRAGISVKSWWSSPPARQYPASGRGPKNPVRDFGRAACQPTCTLADATAASLNVPYFGLAERLGAASVVDAARDAGIDSMWMPSPDQRPGRRVDLRDRAGTAGAEAFSTEVGLGRYPITVLDHANGVATFAAGGLRARVHFVRRVVKAGTGVHAERPPDDGQARVLGQAAVDDLTWTLSRNRTGQSGPAGRLADGRPVAVHTGEWPLGGSAVDTVDAWAVGYTGNLAMAVWVGNEEFELPLRDFTGARIAGSGLPEQIFTRVMAAVHSELGLERVDFATPTFTGDATRGNASPPAG
jgi:membrane peptidoglycan carboxypeptidase